MLHGSAQISVESTYRLSTDTHIQEKCVCVCVCDRERRNERMREVNTANGKDKERQRHRDKTKDEERQKQEKREQQKQRKGGRQRETERKTTTKHRWQQTEVFPTLHSRVATHAANLHRRKRSYQRRDVICADATVSIELWLVGQHQHFTHRTRL